QDIACVEFLHADCDPDTGERPDVFKARTLPILEAHDPPPTAIIDSGNGLQPLWRLSEPAPGDSEPQIEAGEAHKRAPGPAACAPPGTHNIDRLLRLPGTTNLPNATKRRAGRVACRAQLLSWTGFSHPLAAFLQKHQQDRAADDEPRGGELSSMLKTLLLV